MPATAAMMVEAAARFELELKERRALVLSIVNALDTADAGMNNITIRLTNGDRVELDYYVRFLRESYT